MAAYSAMEAINPAIERTRLYLFKPFRLWRFLKIAIIATFAEASYTGGGFNVPFSGGNHGGGSGGGGNKVPLNIPPLHLPDPHMLLLAGAVLIVFLIPLFAVLGYLLIRLRFSFFEAVLDGHDHISVGWRKYHRPALHFLVATYCIGLAFLLLIAAIGAFFFLTHRELMAGIFSGHATQLHLNPMSILGTIATAAILLVSLGLVGAVINSLMTCFVLPRMALEDATFLDAAAEVWADVQAEPGQFALFLLMRVLIPIAASIAGFILLILPIFAIIIAAVLIGLAAHAVIHSTPILILLAIPAALIFLAFFFALTFALTGTVGCFNRNYAILFYAGRYTPLAQRLWRWQPPTVVPPSPFPGQIPGIQPGTP